MDSFFTLLQPTTEDRVLLSRSDNEPVPKPLSLFVGGKRIGRVLETIGRVSQPLYVAELAKGVALKEIHGKKLTTHLPKR